MDSADPSVFLEAFRVYTGKVMLAGGAIAALQSPLMPGEEAYVTSAVEKRRREFAAGRTAARQALGMARLPQGAILSGEHREPLWPAGATGSITHSEELAFAACAPVSSGLCVGLDVEIHARLKRELWRMVFSEAECQSFLATQQPDIAAAAAFSAKESLEKAQFAATGRVMEFADMSVRVHSGGAIEIRQSAGAFFDAVPESLSGMWIISGDHVFTAVIFTRQFPLS